MAIRYWTEDNYFRWLPKLVNLQGRWHYYYDGILWIIPFLSTSFVYYKVVTIGALLLNAVVFYFVIARTTRSGSFAQFVLIVYLLSLQIGGNHSALVGYFVYKHVGMLCVAFSLLFFHKYLNNRRAVTLIWSSLLFALAVPIHETFVLYGAVHALLFVAHSAGSGERLRPKSFAAMAPFVLIGAAFVVATLAFRAAHPTQYAGNTFDRNALNAQRYIETLFVFTRSALPGFFFFDEKFRTVYHHYAAGFTARSSDLAYVLGDLRASWVIRAMVFSGLTVLVLRRAERLSGKALLVIGAVATLLVVIPNSLVSFSALYQDRALDRDFIGTHMTYLTNFGLALLMSAALWSPLRFLVRHRLQIVRVTTIVGLVLMSTFLSVITDFSNHYGAKMLGMHRQKWVAMDEFIRADVFARIPDGEVIFSPDLWSSVYNPYYHFSNYQGWHLVREPYTGETYWAKYIRAKTGRRIWVFGQWMFLHGFLVENPNPDRRFFYLRYAQEPAEPRQFIAVGEVTQDDREHADEVTIVSLSIPEPWMITFEAAEGADVVHTHLAAGDTEGARLTRNRIGDFTIQAPRIDMRTIVVASSPLIPEPDERP